MNIKIITDATVEPVSLTEAKEHLRVSTNDDDTYISRLIKVGRITAEEMTNLSLASKTYEYTLDKFYPSIRLPAPPLESVTSIKYNDADNVEHTMSASDYIVYRDTPAKILPAEDWPDDELYDIGAVKIRYVAGYKTTSDEAHMIVPETVKQAILLAISDYYEFREELLSRGHIPKTIPFGRHALLLPKKNWRL